MRSQKTFDKLCHLIHKMKQNSVVRGDTEAWGDADSLYWLLLRLVEDLNLEGSNRDATSARRHPAAPLHCS